MVRFVLQQQEKEFNEPAKNRELNISKAHVRFIGLDVVVSNGLEFYMC